MSKYDDIIHMQRPQYPDLPPMSIHDRAAQFSPFAALVGYDDAVAETERLTDRRRDMSEEETRELNEALNRLTERFTEDPKARPHIRVFYFIPDEKKAGGRYEEIEGDLRTIDTYHRALVFTDGKSIPIDCTYRISFAETRE
jgi:hypothetical protein